MTHSTTPPRGETAARVVARVFTGILWIAGSAYLVNHGLHQPTPNWVEITSIPFIWAAVIAAPIVAHQAWGARERTATALLMVAAIVGSAYTLSSTIARQSEGADEMRTRVAETERQRADINQRLAEARGWDILSALPEEGRFEATATRTLFGFEDDVVLRVKPTETGEGSIVDMRSVSRVGVSDLGANAERVRSFLADLSGTVTAAP